ISRESTKSRRGSGARRERRLRQACAERSATSRRAPRSAPLRKRSPGPTTDRDPAAGLSRRSNQLASVESARVGVGSGGESRELEVGHEPEYLDAPEAPEALQGDAPGVEH